jgi:hypothetical protein
VGETSFTGIRLDVLVDIIRGLFTFLAKGFYATDYGCPASESPQAFYQALLLIASLARVAPKSVLHNIMPVFTFMGSNLFHRDDNYSFRVVQKVHVSRLVLVAYYLCCARLSITSFPSWSPP